ncbi:MAG: SUMF1/EgtB/PvdO family nonheme iron enzyme [Magnetococcales bacterium]|nr:SUMF1/EgtB/PvdO family nonheme iron enzyme [Magnetococcales bacterium]
MKRIGIGMLMVWVVIGLTAGDLLSATRGVSVVMRSSENPNASKLPPAQLYEESHALVIGIDRYSAGWPRLSNAVKDAEQVAAELEQRGFQVTLKRDLNAAALKEAMERFFILKGENPNARLLVWFAGHGTTEHGEGYLIPADAPLPRAGTRFRLKALSLRRMGEYVRQARSKHLFAVFDACFAGTIFEGVRSAPPPAITRVTAAPVRQFLTSGDANQEVSDDGRFRRYFLEALRGQRRADANRDGYLTASELGMYLTDRVSNLTRNRQTPRYGKLRDPDYDRGDFVFLLPDTAASPPKSPMRPVARQIAASLPRGPESCWSRPQAGKMCREPLVGMAFVWIPKGRFTMGSPPGEKGRKRDEGPQHSVALDGFWMARHEVTNGQLRQFHAGHDSGHYKGHALNGEQQPAVRVSWEQASAFAAWLTEHSASETQDPRYRLPSEAQWEYAARAGSRTARFWGDDPDDACLFANVGDRAFKKGFQNLYPNKPIHNCDDGHIVSAPVGRFKPNRWGIFDMLGNVWEWTRDHYKPTAYDQHRRRNPVIISGDPNAERVDRGGGYRFSPENVRAADRDGDQPGLKNNALGFRLMREADRGM